MKLVQRQGIINTLISYCGMAIGYLNTVLLFPNFLTPEQVGLTRILLNASVLFAQIGALGTFNTAVRFFPWFKEDSGRHHGFLALLSLIASTGILLCTIAVLVFRDQIISYYIDNSALFVDYFYWVIPIGVGAIIYSLFDGWAKAQFETIAPSFLNDVWLRLMVTLSITLYILDIVDFGGFMLCFILVNCINGPLLGIYLWLKGKLPLLALPTREVLARLGEVVKFGLYSLMGGVSSNITKTIDALMIGAMLGLSEVGIYTTAMYITSVILVPSTAMRKTIFPLLANYWRNNQLDSIDRIYKKDAAVNLLSGAFIFLILWINLDYIFMLMPKDYSDGRWVFFLIGAGRLFNVANGANGFILMTSDKYQYNAYFTVLLAVFTALFNYLMIPPFGMNGGALATFLALVAYNILKTGYLKWQYGFFPFDLTTLKTLGVIGMAYLASHFVPVLENPIAGILAKTLPFVVVYLGAAYFLRLSPDFNEILAKILNRLTGRKKD